MRIIIANYRFFVAGGPERYMFKFIEAAEKMHIEVIPFSIDNPQNIDTPYKEYFAKPRSNELMYAETKKTYRNMIGMARAVIWNYDAEKKLRKLIHDTKPDAIYILHEINHLSPSIIRAAKKEHIRVVHRISDFFMFCPKSDFLCGDEICEECINGNYLSAIRNRCVKKSLIGTLSRVFAMKLYSKIGIFDEVDEFICTCEFSKRIMIKAGVDKKKIACIPTFIDTNSIEPCYTNKHYFLFLGRMAHQKGTIYAIHAMNWLKDTDYVLKITGELSVSEDDMMIRTFIKEHNLEKQIVFTGFKSGEELTELIRNSTCIVCPAIWYENLPNTIIEAYAYGKPVIASRIGSLTEIVVDEKTGLLFEMKNAKDMACKMRRFVDDENLSEVYGKEARIICEDKYSLEKHMNSILVALKGNCVKESNYEKSNKI